MITPFALTGRAVRLEPLTIEHAQGLADAAAEDRASFSFTTVPDGPSECRHYIQLALADHAEGCALPWAVRRLSDDRIVGSTRYLDLERIVPAADVLAVTDTTLPTVLEIGSTWYAASAQRTSLNSEAKLLLLSHAFDVWKVLRVTFKTDARNLASKAAITRLGATSEGVRRVHKIASDDTLRDSAYYSILASEWPAIKIRLSNRIDVATGTRGA